MIQQLLNRLNIDSKSGRWPRGWKKVEISMIKSSLKVFYILLLKKTYILTHRSYHHPCNHWPRCRHCPWGYKSAWFRCTRTLWQQSRKPQNAYKQIVAAFHTHLLKSQTSFLLLSSNKSLLIGRFIFFCDDNVKFFLFNPIMTTKKCLSIIIIKSVQIFQQQNPDIRQP